MRQRHWERAGRPNSAVVAGTTGYVLFHYRLPSVPGENAVIFLLLNMVIA